MIKQNLHGYYVDTESGAAFLPPEMLDFIDEHLGGVDKFIGSYNLKLLNDETMLRGLKEAKDVLKAIIEYFGKGITEGSSTEKSFNNICEIINSVEATKQ